MLKQILCFFALIIVSVTSVYADEKSWYEIDGIRLRSGNSYNPIYIIFVSEDIMDYNQNLSHHNNPQLYPVGIELSETLMTSWSFRGGVLEWEGERELKDLVQKNELNKNTTNFRQQSVARIYLYNDFFNASDKAFADANPNWALSGDVKSSRIFFGYLWGVFIPAFKYHRFLKLHFGYGAYYSDISFKINLCSQYKITPIS